MSSPSFFPVGPPEGAPRLPSSVGSSISYAQDSFTVAGASVTVMFLAGEVDMHTDHAVHDALARLLAIGSENVVVDLTGVCFCSVGGFGMLVETARSVEARGDHFALVAGSEHLTSVRALTWPDQSFSRHPTVASAIARLRPGGRGTPVRALPD